MILRSNWLRLFSVFAVLLVCTSIRAAELDLNAPLPADPLVKMGTLPNGMNYWIRAHKTPPQRIGMWLHVGSGSVNEEDNQQGLAHFLEHLAFNGSENFPAGTLIKYFESIGLTFGADQNASTGFDETTYLLSLPDTKDETIAKGLQYFADVAYRLSLLPDEIQKERGVILEEARARKGAGQRILEKLLPLLVPDSRVAVRLPIGKEDIITAADKQRFVDYYSKWYRPDNTTLLIVGDIDPAQVEKLVQNAFKDWKKAENPAKSFDPGIKPYTQTRYAVITDPEFPFFSASIVNIGPIKKKTSIGDYRNELIESVGNWIINRRFRAEQEKGTAPYQQAFVGTQNFMNVCKYIGAQAVGHPDKCDAILLSLLTEIKRCRDYGFLQQELDDALKATLAAQEQAAKVEATRDQKTFLQSMNEAVSNEEKPMSDGQELELIKLLAPAIKLEEVNAAFKKNFAPEARLISVTLPEKKDLKLPTEEQLKEIAAKAEGTKLEALVASERPKSLLEKDPAPGKTASIEEDKDLAIQHVTFENGARVHLRSMDFKKNSVSVTINIAGGEIRETAANRGISSVAALALNKPATHKLSSTVIREMMTGKNISVSGLSSEDVFRISISGDPAQLEEGFRLAYLLMTEPKVEESAVKLWKEQMKQSIEERKSNVSEQMNHALEVMLMNGDPRGDWLTQEQVDRLNIADAQKWLDESLATGPIEAAIVGDIDREVALKLAQKYIGALPRRDVQATKLDELRKLKLIKGPMEETVQVETITPTADVTLGWRGATWKDVKEKRLLQMASQILGVRLREEIRENRSLTYSIFCHAFPSRVYDGTGMLMATFTADPDKAAEATKLSRDIMEKFAADGPTDAEMSTVRKQYEKSLETQMKEPSYWLGILAELEYRGTKLSDVKELQQKMQSYTKEEMMEVVKKYLKEEGRLQVIALPKKAAAGDKKDEPKKEESKAAMPAK
jgi:zinc protease